MDESRIWWYIRKSVILSSNSSAGSPMPTLRRVFLSLILFRYELVYIVIALGNIVLNLGYLLRRKEATTYRGFFGVELQRRHL